MSELANEAVLTDAPVETTETTKEEAERMGAIAFFEDKYGSTVRVIQAGGSSLEFCGGTHVDSLGRSAPSWSSEESIGSNKRRIFAVTGRAALERIAAREHLVRSAADLLRTEPDDLLAGARAFAVPPAREREGAGQVAPAVERVEAAELAAGAVDGVVVARQDSVEPDALRALTQVVLRHDGVRAVALGGSPDGAKVALAVATGGSAERHGRGARARRHRGRRGRGVARVGPGRRPGPRAARGGARRGAPTPLGVSGSDRVDRIGRVVALDLGTRRIGVAYSDSRRTLASPWGTVERSGDPERDHAAVVEAIDEMEAGTVVVGLPLSLSGASGPAAQAALREVAALRQVLEPLGITVETADERFTTVEAQRSLTAAGRKGGASRSVIDSAAAMVLLQAWLDRP